MESNIEYVQNKCYGCQKRQVGCHSKCEDYKKYKEYLEKVNAKERKGKIYQAYQCENHQRIMNKVRGK